jgi:hypothetical protein
MPKKRQPTLRAVDWHATPFRSSATQKILNSVRKRLIVTGNATQTIPNFVREHLITTKSTNDVQLKEMRRRQLHVRTGKSTPGVSSHGLQVLERRISGVGVRELFMACSTKGQPINTHGRHTHRFDIRIEWTSTALDAIVIAF